MTETASSGKRESGGPDAASVEPDSHWGERSRLRLRGALEILAEQHELTTVQALRAAATDRVPLTAYDESRTSSGAERWQNHLFWYLLTNHVHSGWLHATTSGYRITVDGREALQRFPTPKELFDAGQEGYRTWDTARKEVLSDPDPDPATSVIHPGNATRHAIRACAPLLRAWRRHGSAFRPSLPVWTPEAAASLTSHLAASDDPGSLELPGLIDDTARILAAEAVTCLLYTSDAADEEDSV